jgi:hypothetical protein
MDEQSKLAERILDHVADAVISTDCSGAITRWNQPRDSNTRPLPSQAAPQFAVFCTARRQYALAMRTVAS